MKERNINYLKRFQDVVKFLVVKEILKRYPSFDAYKRAANSDKAFKLHSAVNTDLLTKLGRCGGVYNALKFIEQSADVFTYHFHCHKTYKSGKRFARNSWFEVNLKTVEYAFANKDGWNISNEMFSRDAHIWVDRHVFNFKKAKKENEENTMTKEEKIQYQKDYEAGLKAFPLETILKAEARNKRAAGRRLKTRIKKLTQQAMVEEELEIRRLKNEIETLRAENSRLKSLKDLNSDIPDAAPSDRIEYEDFDRYFPDGIDYDDPEQKDLISRISDDCWKKLNEEFEKEKQALEENEKNFDCAKEIKNVQEALKNLPEEPAESAPAVKRHKTVIPDDDIPETFDDHRLEVAKEIANAIKDGTVGAIAGKHFLRMIGCENYRLAKIPEQIAGAFRTVKNLRFTEKFIKTIAPFEKEFDPAECRWLAGYYKDLKALVA